MSLFRRRNAESGTPESVETSAAQSSSVTAPELPAPAPVPPHIERALVTLTSKMQTCLDRLDKIESRLDELTQNVLNAPSHSDVLEVRIHSAKLAAELARATVELRGEIGMASDEARRAARLARATETEEVPMALPVDLDLTREEKKSQDGQGWSATA